MRTPWFGRFSCIMPRVRRSRRAYRRRAALVRASLDASLKELLKAPKAPAPAEPEVNVRKRTISELDEKIAQLEREVQELGSDNDLADGDVGAEELPLPAAREYVPALKIGGHEKKRPRKSKGGGTSEGPGEAASLRCGVCGISVNSDALMEEHLRGKKHALALKAEEARRENRYCEPCELCFTSVAQLQDHCKGRKHRETVARGRPARRG
jgi:hypothetical protein